MKLIPENMTSEPSSIDTMLRCGLVEQQSGLELPQLLDYLSSAQAFP